MIDYVTLVDEEGDPKIGYRYPFNACEILCCENAFIYDKLMEAFHIQEGEDSESSESEQEDKEHKKSSTSKDNEVEEEKSSNNIEDEQDKLDEDKEQELMKLGSRELDIDKITTEINSKTLEKEINNEELGTENNKEKIEGFISEINNELNNPLISITTTSNNNEEILETNINNKEIINAEAKVVHQHETVMPSDVVDINAVLDERVHCLDDQTIVEAHHNKIDDITDNKNTEQNNENSEENKYDNNDFFEMSQDNLKENNNNNNLKEEKLMFNTLDYLFKFIETEEELNFVLAGYFAKIFNHLFNVKNETFVRYIYVTRPDLIDCFIKNINRKSISESLSRLLLANTDDVENSIIKKNDIIFSLLEKLTESNKENLEKHLDITSNISELFMDCLSNNKFFNNFISNIQLLKKLQDVVAYNINDSESIKELIKILTRINENILKDFGSTVTPSFNSDANESLYNFNNDNTNVYDELITKESSVIKANLDSIFDLLSETSLLIISDYVVKNKAPIINTTYDKDKRILGTKK